MTDNPQISMTFNKKIYTLFMFIYVTGQLWICSILGPTLQEDLQGHAILLGEGKKAVLEPCESFQIFCSKTIHITLLRLTEQSKTHGQVSCQQSGKNIFSQGEAATNWKQY